MNFITKKISKLLDYSFTVIDEAKWNSRYNTFRQTYDIHPSFVFNGQGICLYGNGKIVLGANSYMGRYSTIGCTTGCTVEVGRNCSISHYVMIYSENLISNQDFSKTRYREKPMLQ